MELLSLEEASAICKIGKNTLRELAINGDVRGVKLGRPWRFNKEDLLEDIRRLYGKRRTTDKITGEKKWVSINQKVINTIEYDLPHQMEKEYNALLARKTNAKRKNSMTT